MTARTNVADALDTFNDQYGTVLTIALGVYAENMRRTAEQAEIEA
jgi:hypothetical protein